MRTRTRMRKRRKRRLLTPRMSLRKVRYSLGFAADPNTCIPTTTSYFRRNYLSYPDKVLRQAIG